MLNALRTGSQTWTGKVILVIAAAALVIGLGFGDVFRGGGSDSSIAMVGDVEISSARFEAEFRREMSRVQQRSPTLTREQAISMGLADQVLQSLIGEALIEEEANSLQVNVADTMVRDEILEQGVFSSENGDFDRTRYEQILRQNGLTPEIYEERIRAGIRSDQLIDSVTGDRPAPRTLSDVLYKFRNEARSARIAIVPKNTSYNIGTPSSADIQTYYEAHPDRFTAPEYRAITYLLLTPESLIDEIELSEDDLRAEYNGRAAAYDVPERRDIRQVLSPDEELIREGRTMLNSGRSFEEVSESLAKRGGTALNMGGIERASLPIEAGDIVFKLAEGEASDAVKTPLGWHLFQVDKVTPATRSSFDDIREDLHLELAYDAAIDSLYRLSTVLEDELAGGASLEQAGQVIGIDSMTIPSVDSSGSSASGGPSALYEIADGQEILLTAFDTEINQESTLVESAAGNYFILRVDNITPPELRSLDSTREQVVAGWQAEARANQAQRAAEHLAKRVQGGESLSAIAKTKGYDVVLASDLLRDSVPANRGVSQEIIAGLFSQQPGSPEPVVGEVTEGFSVAILTKVTAAEPNRNKALAKRFRIKIGRERRNDISALYRFSLSTQHQVSTNQTALQAFLNTR
tara:strand:- start:395 stop:2299 length:1905 start_codon:yes stop_codon:yes gene_type:complete